MPVLAELAEEIGFQAFAGAEIEDIAVDQTAGQAGGAFGRLKEGHRVIGDLGELGLDVGARHILPRVLHGGSDLVDDVQQL